MSGFPEGTPTVTIDLGGPRELGFTLGAMRRAKEELGTLEIDEKDNEAMLLKVPAYVWACMTPKDRKELTVEAVADMIHPLNMKVITEAVTTLFKASQPDDSVGNEPPAAAKKPTAGEAKSTSASSGQSESMT